MLYPNLRRSFGLQRYSSLGVGGNQGGSGGIGNRSRNGAVNTNSLPTGLDPIIVKQTSKHCLSPDDIIDKYREAIVHYSKVSLDCFACFIVGIGLIIFKDNYIRDIRYRSNQVQCQ